MFELRLQDAQASHAGTVEGLSIGRFPTYADAVNSLDGEHERLAAQLAANGEGWADLQVRTAIIELNAGAETGWLWSSYRPGAADVADW
jgi:hypothetical protein